MASAEKTDVRSTLQADILRLEGFRTAGSTASHVGLEPLLRSFPNASFPVAAIHEFLSAGTEDVAATHGFVAGLLSSLMARHSTIVWISASRKLFPPALKNFGLSPERFIFIDVKNERDVLWAMDEALKCNALSTVVGEMKEISFTNSRRLQRAVEQSRVTGFVLRSDYRSVNPTVCVSRWKITPRPSQPIDDLPGIGHPAWSVELSKIKNGKPGTWHITWKHGKFALCQPEHGEGKFAGTRTSILKAG